MTTYTISEVSKQIGLSIDTLRYYERIGLLVNIDRTSSGHRCYSVDDIGWLNLLVCLRTTGMSIADMQRFSQLVRASDTTKPERIILLREHRQNVLNKIALMQQKLMIVDGKIEHYTKQVTTK